MISLFDHQKEAVNALHTGAVLWGGVGSGKTLTALAYFFTKELDGSLDPISNPTVSKDLYVITTAAKRDTHDWEKEAGILGLSTKRDCSASNILLTVDSWNNIKKYKAVKNAFFIFDEQKISGSGSWVLSFYKIAKANNWILLSATPGDVWKDYVPLFVANGFYDNKSHFDREHVVYNTYTNYPKIDRYVKTGKLLKLRNQILVKMNYTKRTITHIVPITVEYNHYNMDKIFKDRWNPYKNRPIENASEAGYSMRRVANSHSSRFDAVLELFKKHPKLIVFYNFDYELDILRRLNDVLDVPVAEHNGHLHEPVPQGESWIYLAQYLSAGEGWNCTETNALILYSRNYSYRITTQAMGRIDRQNTPFKELYYYFLTTNSEIDKAITKSYTEKKDFNEVKFFKNRLAS